MSEIKKKCTNPGCAAKGLVVLIDQQTTDCIVCGRLLEIDDPFGGLFGDVLKGMSDR